MNLVADEGVDGKIVSRLRSDGHEVYYVAESAPGISDAVVLGVANEKHATLITSDKDFGELVFRQRRVNAGVILLRLEGLAAATKASLTSEAISTHATVIQGSFTVVAPGVVRIRRQRTL